jgi:hypothetical protein
MTSSDLAFEAFSPFAFAEGEEEQPTQALGTLELRTPKQSMSYRFTPNDLVWTAKLLVWEAGGEDNPDNAAVLWAMFNRYALFTHRVFPAFADFVRAYSTTLQPVLRSAQAAARHMHEPEFVRTGGTYPGTDIPRGQLRRHLDIQRAPWRSVKLSARNLATRALTGRLPNPGIGLASEFASTRVYFKQYRGRYPTVDEWRRYTVDLAARKRWRWVGDVPGLNQMKNAFFVDLRAAGLPAGAVRVLPPGGAAGAGESDGWAGWADLPGEEFERGEWELDDRESAQSAGGSGAGEVADPGGMSISEAVDAGEGYGWSGASGGDGEVEPAAPELEAGAAPSAASMEGSPPAMESEEPGYGEAGLDEAPGLRSTLQLAQLEPEFEGPGILERLRGIVAFGLGQPLRLGSTGSGVAVLQRALRRLGHGVTDPEGTFAASTAAAVRAFQTRHGLCANGVAGGQTKGAITRAIARLNDPAADPLPAAIVRVALAQLPRWHVGGRYLLETDAAATPILQEYYRDGVCREVLAAHLQSAAWHRDNYWSAVFVSWVMRSAGAGTAFAYSTAHRTYVRAARRNRCQGNTANPFWAYRATEVAPEPGDLVCRARPHTPPATYENIEQPVDWPLHCDIVTSAPQGGRIMVVGGNVAVPGAAGHAGLTAAQRPVRVRPDGRIDLSGNQSTYIAVVRCRGAAPGVPVAC